MLKFIGFLLICIGISLGLNIAKNFYGWKSFDDVVLCASRSNNVEATIGLTTCQMPITIRDMVFVGLCVLAGYFWWKN